MTATVSRRQYRHTPKPETTALIEDVEFLVDCGTPAHEIAQRLAHTVIAIERALHRYNRADLIVRMTSNSRRRGLTRFGKVLAKDV